MIGVYIQLGSTTVEQYRALDAKVQAAGVSEEGCMLHTCFQEGDNLAVFDVWESQEAFEAFGAGLAPLVGELGLAMPTPHFVEMVTYEPR